MGDTRFILHSIILFNHFNKLPRFIHPNFVIDEIVLEQSLGRQARQEVLAHELVHAERGVGWPDASAATMEVEEERVWRIALRRLVPPAQIARFLAQRGTVGPVTVADLAEEFDLTSDAAARVAQLYAVTGGIELADDDA